ncbi:hypothetical protein JCM11641_002342 [Rhodosporidiobolus odoratus]
MFRPSVRRLAAEISSTGNIGCSSTPAAELLPPLVLYRRLLRVHRKVLPRELRVMGDEYVKAEFRRTRTSDNPLHIVGFLGEWGNYLDFHESQLPSSPTTPSCSPSPSSVPENSPPVSSSESSTSPSAAEEQREKAAWERLKVGQKLDEGVMEQLFQLLTKTSDVHVWNQLSADQIGQLYELFLSTKDVFLTPEEAEEKARLAAAGISNGAEGEEGGLVQAAEELVKKNRGD